MFVANYYARASLVLYNMCVQSVLHFADEAQPITLTPDMEQVDEVVSLAHCKQLPVGYGADQFGTTSVDGVQVGLGVGRWLERERGRGW